MTREDEELRAAKRGHRTAEREGNHEEEARWANMVGDILKRRGEYVEALRWLRIDYEVSVKHLPQKQLLPTCQCLGELYFRLDQFKEALAYQKKHLELAKESDDLVEQQRASTQLGRTYHEMFLRSENDHYAVRNAKKYFKLAMKFARTLKENPPCSKSSTFLKEFIDAHNNLGMLEMDLDNLDDAKKILLQGLKICDEEEVTENDDGRSRLNHNLGSLYIELREWGKARVHIEKDILICKKIAHLQGEAKGFINLAELHYRVQKYEEAILCYKKALDIAKRMEDEDALVDQITQNIKTVNEAAQVLEELKKEEQKLRKLTRATCDARGTSHERKCLLEQNVCLDTLIEKAGMIFAWPKHREFAKRKKRVASELCDKEKLGDSFLAIGESYQKLRNYGKARKWYMKSWNVYKSIDNLEGQALTKINIGEVLDSSGDWAGALEAFEEGYRMAVCSNLPSVQMSALNNMHYSHMIRFDNIEEARKLQHDIQELKHLLDKEDILRNLGNDYCSETETEGDDVSYNVPSSHNSLDITNPKLVTNVENYEDEVPLSSLFRRSKNPSKIKTSQLSPYEKEASKSCNLAGDFLGGMRKSGDNQQPVGRKRSRVVISDDEADEMNQPCKEPHRSLIEDMITNRDNMHEEATGTNKLQDVSLPGTSRDVLSTSTPVCNEESICSFRSKSPKFTTDNGMEFGSSSNSGIANAFKVAENGSKMDSGHNSESLLQNQNGAGLKLAEDGHHSIMFKIGHDFIRLNTSSLIEGDNLTIEHVKIEVACVYYLQFSEEKRSKGLLPVIGHLTYCGKVLYSLESTEELNHFARGNVPIEVVVAGWVPKRLMKLYLDQCVKLSEAPSMKLLKKLYNLEVSEDDITVSDCGLQDLSILPFLNALEVHRTVAILDISHNLVGNETLNKLKKIFTSSSQTYGGLTLDLHCNRFGPSALFQICECPVMFARLEVLNLSENRLTDACSFYLSSILKNCRALYSLNIEQCSITSRTIQKIADSLQDESVLSHLSLGKNTPISGNAIVSLLSKLATLKRFSELSLTGIRLNRVMIDSLCKLAAASSLSVLLLGGTYIGTDASVKLMEALSSGPQELVKFDLSCCGLTSHGVTKVCTSIASLGGVLELNLGGNSIGQEGCDVLGAILADPQCSLKSLFLNKCHLGMSGILQIIQSLSGNESLEELYLAENADIISERTLQYDSAAEATPLRQKSNVDEVASAENVDCNGLEVADSEDEAAKERTSSARDASCASSCRRSRFAGSELVHDVSAAIALATQLQLVDLSRNGLSLEDVESLYSAWSSSGSRCGGLARKHVKDDIVHFSVEGKRCCGVKPCCRRD